jgi:hypothetical protein
VTAAATEIRFEIHICAERRSYYATFSTEAQALAFLEPRGWTHAYWPATDADTDLVEQNWPTLADRLWPICEHGLSLQLCSGPNHFGEPYDDWAN